MGGDLLFPTTFPWASRLDCRRRSSPFDVFYKGPAPDHSMHCLGLAPRPCHEALSALGCQLSLNSPAILSIGPWYRSLTWPRHVARVSPRRPGYNPRRHTGGAQGKEAWRMRDPRGPMEERA